MLTLEALAARIATTEDLRSIVRTMKSLSAVSIHQYETAEAAIAEYQRTIELGLQIALRDRPPQERARSEAGGRAAVLLFGSDHGLCGRFNDQVVDFALERLAHERIVAHSCHWLVVGARAQARLEARDVTPSTFSSLPGSVGGLTSTVETILTALDAWRQDEPSERVLIFFNHGEARGTPEPRVRHLLPLDRRYLSALAHRPWASRSLPTYTMDAGRLFSALVQQYLFVTVYRAGVESMAAEHAIRLSAMQAAERNIAENLEEMQGDYRRERQSAITAELLDIIAGYEVLRE